MDSLGLDPTDPLAIFETQSYDARDFVELFSKNRTEKEWDEIMERLLPDLPPAKKSVEVKKGKRKNYENGLKKYKHTPKWFKKKMIQELKTTLEFLNQEDRNILRCVPCECY